MMFSMHYYQQYFKSSPEPYCRFLTKPHIVFSCLSTKHEPRHDKTNIVRLRQAWTQTSLRIHAVWSGSMLFAVSFSTCNIVGKQTAWILIRLRECAGWSGSINAGHKRTMLVLSRRGSNINGFRLMLLFSHHELWDFIINVRNQSWWSYFVPNWQAWY
jgi:hypothetical protein